MKKTKTSIMALMGIMAASACFAGCSGVKGNHEDAEKEAAKFIEAVYQSDYQAIFEMMPNEFQERALESTKMYMEEESSKDELLAHMGASLEEYVHNLDLTLGEGWNMEYEVKEVTEYTKEQLEKLAVTYKMMGVKDYKIDNAANVLVKINFDAVNGTKGDTELLVPLVCSKGTWKVGQYINIEDMEDAMAYNSQFGDLMDGFSVEGFFDADGNEIFYDEEGYQITEEKDGTWTGTDEFGNIRHYDKDKNLVEVTGPDGGEPLDERTWNVQNNETQETGEEAK